MATSPHVGTLRERPLHADLKRWCAREGDLFEQSVDGFVIDILRQDLLIEVQTRSFASMRRKLATLLRRHRVRIVHPIAVELWIVKVDDTGEILSRRKSPKRGSEHDLFAELVSFPELIAHPNLSLELLLVRTEQVRRFDPNRAWRRKGWVIEENELLEVFDTVVIETPEHLVALLPDSMPTEFTTADLARELKRPRRLAQQMTFCLRRTGGIEVVGRDGRAVVYRRTLRDSAVTN